MQHILVALLAIVGGACAQGATTTTTMGVATTGATSVTTTSAATVLVASLAGANEVPDRASPLPVNNGPDAYDLTGTARIALESDGLVCFDLQLSGDFSEETGVGALTAGHIHSGPPGVAGPVVVTLFSAPTVPATTDNGVGSGTATLSQCVYDSAGVSGDIAANPEAFYVNVHSSKYAGGAARGQLSADGGGGATIGGGPTIGGGGAPVVPPPGGLSTIPPSVAPHGGY